jgi:hypothetical protein
VVDSQHLDHPVVEPGPGPVGKQAQRSASLASGCALGGSLDGISEDCSELPAQFQVTVHGAGAVS